MEGLHTSLSNGKLKYITDIRKIPEYLKFNEDELHLLQCSDTYSIVTLYDNFFDIICALYDMEDLRKQVLLHIKTNRRFYASVGSHYLKGEKLKLVDWLSDMLYCMVPADELCLFACGLYLNIHITVDYHQGYWSTLNLGGTSHDLISALSDVHLVYRGFCKYNNFCRKLELKTNGYKILNHKYKNNGNIVIKKLTVCLTRVEEYNKMAKKLLTTVSKPLPNVTPASAKNKALKDLRIVLQKVDELGWT